MSRQRRRYRPDNTFWVSETHDDATRIVTTFNEAGEVTSTRPYTADENAAADFAAAREAALAEREGTLTTVKAIVTDLQAEKARCDVVIAKANNAITGGDTKDVARAAKRIADAAIELARYVQDGPTTTENKARR